MSKNRNVPVACNSHLKYATLALRNTSRWMFSARRRVLLSEHVSPAVLKRRSLGALFVFIYFIMMSLFGRIRIDYFSIRTTIRHRSEYESDIRYIPTLYHSLLTIISIYYKNKFYRMILVFNLKKKLQTFLQQFPM